MRSRFVCPKCGASGRLPEGFAPDRIKCPVCKMIGPVELGSDGGAMYLESAVTAWFDGEEAPTLSPRAT